MICENSAKSYCKDDISLIENYDKAIADKTQVWDCHHRRETIFSKSDLIEIGEYYNRPACELIFLTPTDHRRLHNLGKPSGMKGKHHSAETRKKMSEAHKGKQAWNKGIPQSEEAKKKNSEAHKGENNYWFGKHHSEEARKKMSEKKKGKPSWMKGKHHSEDTRKKMSEKKKGKSSGMKSKHHSAEARKKMSEVHKGTHWYNNGVKCIKAKTCPEGFVPGRIK